MIDISFTIKNPFAKQQFKNIQTFYQALTTNKAFEAELLSDNTVLFTIEIDTEFRGSDHAGPNIVIGAFGYLLHLGIYDCRHWNYKNNTWEVPTDEQA